MVLRYKVVASSADSRTGLAVRTFDTIETATDWIDQNISVLAPEDKAKLAEEGYLILSRARFVTIVQYQPPWWAPKAWIEDEGDTLAGAAIFVFGFLLILAPLVFEAGNRWGSWYPASLLLELYGLFLIFGLRRRV